MTSLLRRPVADPDHWNRIWVLLVYPLLAALSVIAVVRATDGTHRGILIALSLLLAAWHAWFILAHQRWWERALLPMAVYFLGVVALLALLVSYDGVLRFAVVGFVPMAFVALPGRWAYPGVLVLSLLMVENGLAGLWRGEFTASGLVFVVVVTIVIGVIGGMMRVIEREAIRGNRINAELRAMAEENLALHERLVERARHAGVAAERARLARDMHDTVAQGLTGIVTQLETAEVESTLDESTRRRLEIVRQLARDNLVEVRRTVEALRPAALEDADLADALAAEVAAWRRRNDIAADFTVTGTPGFADADVAEAVLRAAQEALSNVARHAEATRVGVTLSYLGDAADEDDLVVLDVRDDGVGFVVGERPGFGLIGMRQRVEPLGGRVDVESTPGTGTAISVSLPLRGDRR